MSVNADPQESEVNVDGTISVGALAISIKNIDTVGGNTAQVNGVDLPPGEAKSYFFIGKPYPVINYVVSGATLRILAVY